MSQFKLQSQNNDSFIHSKSSLKSKNTQTNSKEKSQSKGQKSVQSEFDEATGYQEPGEKKIES